jgi:hypothetical protein
MASRYAAAAALLADAVGRSSERHEMTDSRTFVAPADRIRDV